MSTTVAPHLPPMHASERWLLRACLLLPLAALVLFFWRAHAGHCLAQPGAGHGWHRLGQLRRAARHARRVEALANSLLLGAVTTAITLVLAFVVASGAHLHAGPPLCGRGRWPCPCWRPRWCWGWASSFCWGATASWGKMLGVRPEIYGFWGLLTQTFSMLPQAVLIVRTALRQGDARQYDAAEVLGATPWRQFCDITLPQARYGLLERGLVVFTITITDLATPWSLAATLPCWPPRSTTRSAGR